MIPSVLYHKTFPFFLELSNSRWQLKPETVYLKRHPIYARIARSLKLPPTPRYLMLKFIVPSISFANYEFTADYVGVGAAAPVMPSSASSTGSTGPQVQKRFMSP